MFYLCNEKRVNLNVQDRYKQGYTKLPIPHCGGGGIFIGENIKWIRERGNSILSPLFFYEDVLFANFVLLIYLVKYLENRLHMQVSSVQLISNSRRRVFLDVTRLYLKKIDF